MGDKSQVGKGTGRRRDEQRGQRGRGRGWVYVNHGDCVSSVSPHVLNEMVFLGLSPGRLTLLAGWP